MAKVIDINTIWKRKIQPQYSILNLLIEAKSNGLQAKHIRYALIENHDKNNLSDFTTRRVKQDFTRLNINLYELRHQGRIKKGCIPEGNSISNILKRLHDRDIIRKDKRFKNTRWKISLEYVNEGVRSNNKSTLDTYDTDNIMEYTRGDTQHVMYGVSKRIYYGLPRTDMFKVDGCINEIDSKLKEIWTIIFNRYMMIWAKQLVKVLRSYSNLELVELFLKDDSFQHVFVVIHNIIFDTNYIFESDYTETSSVKDIIDKHPEFIKRAIQIYKSNSMYRVFEGLTYVCSTKKENPLI